MKNAGLGVGVPDAGRVRLAVENGRLAIHTAPPAWGRAWARCWCRSSRKTPALPATRSITTGSIRSLRPTPARAPAPARRCSPARRAAAPARCSSAARAGRPLAAMEGEEFLRRIHAPHRPARLRQAQPRQPCGLRLRHAGGHPGRGRAASTHRRRARRGARGQPALRRGADRGRRGHEHGLCADGALSARTTAARRRALARWGCSARTRSRPSSRSSSKKPGLDAAGGAIGIGEITSIPTAPAIAEAYYRFDGKERNSLPLADTPYSRK